MKFNLLTALMILCIIVLGYRFLKEGLLITFCREESQLDNKIYNVQCSYADKQKAANLLSQLNVTSHELINYVYNKYGDKENKRGKAARNLKKRYQGRSRMVETDPNNSEKDTSYVIDKGFLLSLCLRRSRDKDESDFHTLNVLKFVLIHELAHIASDVDGHPYKFWVIFKWLLKEAQEATLYEYHSFEQKPINYCTYLDISYTPSDDPELEDLN